MGLSSPKVNPILKIFKLRWLPTKGKHLVLTRLSTFGCLLSNFHWFIATKHVGDSWFGSFQWSLGMWFVRQLSFTPPRGGCMPVFFYHHTEWLVSVWQNQAHCSDTKTRPKPDMKIWVLAHLNESFNPSSKQAQPTFHIINITI